MGGRMDQVAIIERPWREPAAAARPFAEEPYALLLSGWGGWSYLARTPDHVLRVGGDDPQNAFSALAEGLAAPGAWRADGPPFQGGWAGLIAYEFGARAEPMTLPRHPDWPDLDCGLYRGLLAFDHDRRRVLAVGRGADAAEAQRRAAQAAGWLDVVSSSPEPDDGPMSEALTPSSAQAFEAQVAEVVARIAAGEVFQANIARRWTGRLAAGRTPYALFERLLRDSPAPFAGYLRLEGRAVASNSPERFIRIDPRPGPAALTQPIKGTRPRGDSAAEDLAQARALLADPKDRAENLMIVDLMRNDLARVSRPGAVKVPALFALESFANVHHLVSTVTGELLAGVGPAEVLKAAFPPGSITGAPKVQAMKVIAALEPPRGPYCGSLFWAGFDGGMDSSVLIRTVACVRDAAGWRIEAGAGAGIVADSDPRAERLETEAKIAAIRRALCADAPAGAGP
jgi:para-aminobenzoate synthetase component 1